MSLLPPAAFHTVFGPLVGQQVGYVRGPGNVGDRLIEEATLQLLRAYNIRFVEFPQPTREAQVDLWLAPGGGNMGDLYPSSRRLRERMLATGQPVVVLPQSFSHPEALPYQRVHVREAASLRLHPGAELAPDLALGLGCRTEGTADLSEGLWLRQDGERLFHETPNRGDPALICRSAQEYVALAGRHTHVITDRLHFAIAALLCGRRATLLPNSYHKNRAMYDTWLRHLGCDWRDTP